MPSNRHIVKCQQQGRGYEHLETLKLTQRLADRLKPLAQRRITVYVRTRRGLIEADVPAWVDGVHAYVLDREYETLLS
jgi:hypothetical protein